MTYFVVLETGIAINSDQLATNWHNNTDLNVFKESVKEWFNGCLVLNVKFSLVLGRYESVNLDAPSHKDIIFGRNPPFFTVNFERDHCVYV